MADIDALLNRWQRAGVVDAETAARIRAWEEEQEKPGGLRWQGLVALILGAILLACGVVLFVSAHWDQVGPGARFALVMAMVAVFHLCGAFTRKSYGALGAAFHAVGTVTTGAAIALVGQIFNIEEHWPTAVLLWALAALAGWILLHDEAQEILALLLVPAWLLSEIAFAAENHIGQNVFVGRFLMVWAVLYLTFFLGSKRKAVQGILFAAAAIGGVVGTALLAEGWHAWGDQIFVHLSTRVWMWAVIGGLPMLWAVFHFGRSLVPVSAALVYSIAMPWCHRAWVEHYDVVPGLHGSYMREAPTLAAHALAAAFAVFLIWWGVRLASRALVNLGIVYFAVAVAWFYFSDVFDKVGRSLGLIGLGVLFLAGGWALEKMRRRLMARMSAHGAALKEAQ